MEPKEIDQSTRTAVWNANEANGFVGISMAYFARRGTERRMSVRPSARDFSNTHSEPTVRNSRNLVWVPHKTMLIGGRVS